jgi:hypothetical protein
MLEERTLKYQLDSLEDCVAHVRYRLVPPVW